MWAATRGDTFGRLHAHPVRGALAPPRAALDLRTFGSIGAVHVGTFDAFVVGRAISGCALTSRAASDGRSSAAGSNAVRDADPPTRAAANSRGFTAIASVSALDAGHAATAAAAARPLAEGPAAAAVAAGAAAAGVAGPATAGALSDGSAGSATIGLLNLIN